MRNKSIIIEGCILLGIAFLSLVLLGTSNFFEQFHVFSRQHESWNLDDILLSFPVFLLCFIIFITRRLRDLRREIIKREQAEKAALAAEERAQDALKMKEQFMSVVCHELRTPLNGVLGILTILKDEEGGTDDTKQLVDLALQRGRDLDQLIDDVLFFVRMGKTRVFDAFSEFDPQAVISTVHSMVLPQAEAKGLSMPPPVMETPDMLVGLESGIRHIVLNLGENAVKFTDNGHVFIRLSYQPESEKDGQLILEVEDTGPGISAADQAQIFEPFRQLDGSSTRKNEGIGLGLSLVKELVNVLHGELILTSTVGKGSTFRVTLPVSKP
ncbi:sensor histidine kinase [Desulfovibrio inopinatus]|uniref:sensor histidine kinase n=1 Tax=Desulfovibrio inopinatus TaxID=102109 RepID=UPI00040ED1CC|nr:HAMP domain-containing sensor histidine kinase [Desulfovibrio inopinatus]